MWDGGWNYGPVGSFRLDKYLVTVGRFRQFVAAWKGGWLPAEGAGKHTHLNGGQGLADSATATSDGGATSYETGWIASDDSYISPTDGNLGSCSPYSTWTDTAGSQENLPINCVNFYEAYAFCIWDGGFLPSWNELSYAMSGGTQSGYPWGSAAPRGNTQYAVIACKYPSGTGTCTGVTNIAPVGYASLGAGAWGHMDLMGEVEEWVVDSWTVAAGGTRSCMDCAYLSRSPNGTVGQTLGPSFRDSDWPFATGRGSMGYSSDTGFRCARVP